MTTEFEFDPNAGFSIDQGTVETPDSAGPMFPVIQWHYGDPKQLKAGGMDYLGGWFFSTDTGEADSDEQKERKARVAVAMGGAGWEETTWIHDSGETTTGMWKREIAVSVISVRKCWQVYVDNNRPQSFPWTQYEAATQAGRPSSRAHVAVLVKGLEAEGPFVLTLKGSASMAFEGTRKVNGALQEFSRTVIAKANALSAEAAKKAGKPAPKWPLRCFWLPVGADRDAKGAPKFTEVGSGNSTSRVCLPIALGLSKDPDLKRFYVGPELKDKTQAVYEELEEWRRQWENFDAKPTEEAPKETAKVEPTSGGNEALAALGL